MRTVFVNPSNPRRRRKRSNPRRRARRHNPRRRRRNSSVALANPRRRRRRNAGVTPFVSQNPMILSNPRRRRRRRNPSHTFLGHIAYIVGGTVGGAALNRLAFNQLENLYARNGVRILGASILAYLGGNNNLTAAAAGAILAPLLPEIEAHLTAATPKAPEKKNPRELAAELSALLEADLSDDELSDDDGLSDDEMSDELDDDLIDDDLIDDDLEGVGAMKW
jgi:hypothetical protein